MKIEDEVRDALRNRADAVSASVDQAWRKLNAPHAVPSGGKRVAAALVAVAVFTGAVLLLARTFAPNTTSRQRASTTYDSATGLAAALHDAGLGCDHLGTFFGILQPGVDVRSCQVNGEEVWLWVYQTPEARQRFDAQPSTSPNPGGILNVRGENWLVATKSVAAAQAVQNTIGGTLEGLTPSSSPSPAPPGWVTHTDDAGVSIDTPVAWTFNGDPVPGLAEPAMLFAIGTGAVPTGGDCAPRPAIDALPKDGTLFALQEYGSVDEPYTFPPRTDQFNLGPLMGPFECFGVKAHEIEFQDGGRFFQVFAMFGADASASLRHEVAQSLDSLRVEPLPSSAQPAAECQSGQWTSCPEAAWAYQVINRAHVVQLGHRGVQAILGVAGKRSFALWTTSSDQGLPSGQCRAIAGTNVCQVGTRLVWEAQGLLLWVEPAPSPYSSLHTDPGLPAGAVLERLVRASERVGLMRA